MNRVLVTGATGFIGRHCLERLSATECEVHAVSSKLPGKEGPGVQWHHADLLNSEQLSRIMSKVQPSHLLHLAWYAVPGKYWTSQENFRWVQASLGLLQAFSQNGGERAVMAGTCAEYDWDYGYCSELATPLRPQTVYGVCKHSLQAMAQAFGKEAELSVAWGRIFFLYGPHEHPQRLVPSVIGSLLQGQFARCTHGNQIRDYLHIEDAADAFVRLLDSHVEGPVNIASGVPIVLKELLYTIAERVGGRDLVHLGALPAPREEPPLLLADTRLLKEQVGWRPRYNLNRGLEQTIDWWKDRIEAEESVLQ